MGLRESVCGWMGKTLCGVVGEGGRGWKMLRERVAVDEGDVACWQVCRGR